MDSSSAATSAPVATPPAAAGGYISNPLELIKPSWAAFKLAWLNLLLLILAFGGIFLVLLVVVGVGGPVGAIIGFLAAIPAIILGVGYLGYASSKTVLSAV